MRQRQHAQVRQRQHAQVRQRQHAQVRQGQHAQVRQWQHAQVRQHVAAQLTMQRRHYSQSNAVMRALSSHWSRQVTFDSYSIWKVVKVTAEYDFILVRKCMHAHTHTHCSLTAMHFPGRVNHLLPYLVGITGAKLCGQMPSWCQSREPFTGALPFFIQGLLNDGILLPLCRISGTINLQ